MSKKSRRRNRRILGALGALGALALMGRRGNQMSAKETVSDAQKSSQLGTPKKKPTKVYTDPIMKGGKGVKPSKVVPRLKVTDRGNVIRDGVDTGVGNMKTKFIGGDGKIFRGGKEVGEVGVTSPGISVRNDGSIMAKGVLYPNKTAYANRNKVQMEPVEGVTIPEENFKTSEFDYFAKGGRVKKKPFAKRGFGRAYKKGRR